MADGYTKIKNILFDGLARLKVSANAYMILHAIIRNTLCFHQNQREISNSFLQGATGLNERSVRRALKELEARGIIKIASPNCGSHPKTIRILTDKIGRCQNPPGEEDKSGRDNPDKSGSQEIKENRNIKENSKKETLTSLPDEEQCYATLEEAAAASWEDDDDEEDDE